MSPLGAILIQTTTWCNCKVEKCFYHLILCVFYGFQTHRIKCDRSTGMIEMVMDRFTIENEGTYTVQIQDGKAKNQSSLVLIGDGMPQRASSHFEKKSL